MKLFYTLQAVVLVTGISAVLAVWDDIAGWKRKAFVCLFVLGLLCSLAALAWQYKDQKDAIEKAAEEQKTRNQILSGQINEANAAIIRQAEILTRFERLSFPLTSARLTLVMELDPKQKDVREIVGPSAAGRQIVVIALAGDDEPSRSGQPSDSRHALAKFLRGTVVNFVFVHEIQRADFRDIDQTLFLTANLENHEFTKADRILVYPFGERIFFISSEITPIIGDRSPQTNGIYDLRSFSWRGTVYTPDKSPARLLGVKFNENGAMFTLEDSLHAVTYEGGSAGMVPGDWDVNQRSLWEQDLCLGAGSFRNPAR
ncbi:MAG: hypothetical protein ABSB74_13000 [Tepidisphaeraceae bacterium]